MKLLQAKIVKFHQRFGGKRAKTAIFREVHKSKNRIVTYLVKIQGYNPIFILKIGEIFGTF